MTHFGTVPHFLHNFVTHQVDKLLVADLALLVALYKSKQHLKFGWIQLQFMALKQIGKVLHSNETSILRIKLKDISRRNY